MDDDALPRLDRALAEPHHLLVLPAEVRPEEVEALAVSHFDDAGWLGPTALQLNGEAQLTGPWRLDDPIRTALDLPRWAATAMLLRCPVQRSAPVPPELRGLGGLLDAFPEGEPVGLERRVLDHLLAQARCLAGALRVAGTGAVLVPDPASAVDLTVHSFVWLEPEACARVLAPVLPDMTPVEAPPAERPADRLATDVDRPADRLATDVDRPATDADPQRARAMAELSGEERAWLHAQADALDEALLAKPQVLAGYAHVVAVPGGALEVGVAGSESTPPVLRALPWARGGVISYEIRWRPDDPAVALGSRPPLAVRRRRNEVRTLVAHVALALHAVVGGEIADDDAFLVAPKGLTAR